MLKVVWILIQVPTWIRLSFLILKRMWKSKICSPSGTKNLPIRRLDIYQLEQHGLILEGWQWVSSKMMTRLVVSQLPFEIKKLLQLLLSNLQSVIWVPGTSVYYDELDPCTYLFKLNDLSIACCTANSCKKEECARDISSNNSSATPRIQSCKIPSQEENNSLVLIAASIYCT